MKSSIPYGIAGWMTTQTYLFISGSFNPLPALISLGLIVALIGGIEFIVRKAFKVK